MSDHFRLVCRWIEAAARIVPVTGAGISTDSGIPDFRGPQGIWTKNPKAEKLSNIHSYMSDPDVRRLSWKSGLAPPAWQATPIACHRALVQSATGAPAIAMRGSRIISTVSIDWPDGQQRR